MLTNLKALVVILAIATLIFVVAKPYVLRYVDPVSFARRRLVWYVLTIAGFVSPSFWMYAAVALPLMFWGARKDQSPLAFYIMMAFVVPDVRVEVPTVGIGRLLELGQFRMMSLVILLPLLATRLPVSGMTTEKRFTAMDWTLLALGLLQIALVLPYDSPTNTLRRGTEFFLDTFLIFYAFARLEPSAKAIRGVLATYVLIATIMAAFAIFESGRGWLLYVGIPDHWGVPDRFTAYLARGNLLRAQVAAGHSLRYGYLAALGLGFSFYLLGQEPRKVVRYGVFFLLASGVFLSGSRGAWLAAFLMGAAYIMLRPNAGRMLIGILPALAVGTVVAYNSPLKESLIDKLPIIGTADQDTVGYRQQIAEVSWRLIKQNPVFGDPFALRNMEELRQGQGIIDIMNGYANVAVFSGGVGFALFIGTFLIALWRSYLAMRTLREVDSSLALLGADLIACLLGSLFFVGTAAVDPLTYCLAGAMACYSSIAIRRREPVATTRSSYDRPGIDHWRGNVL